jgi:hypothetical protein
VELAIVDGVEARECVGCGFCCMQAPCLVSLRIYNGTKSCPAFYWNESENKYRCKLMELKGSQGFKYREELSAGAGCCSGLNSWRQNVINRIEPEQKNKIPFDKYFQEFVFILGKQWLSGDVVALTLSAFKRSIIEKFGISDKDATQLCSRILHIMREQQSSFTKGFIGEIGENLID